MQAYQRSALNKLDCNAVVVRSRASIDCLNHSSKRALAEQSALCASAPIRWFIAECTCPPPPHLNIIPMALQKPRELSRALLRHLALHARALLPIRLSIRAHARATLRYSRYSQDGVANDAAVQASMLFCSLRVGNFFKDR